MKIKYMAWQMLCLFLCAGVNAWAAPDTSSIPENASQVYASDVATDSVQDNDTTSANDINDDTKDDNAPIKPSEPRSEQKPEKPERELTEAELIDPENPQPVHTNTDDKSPASQDNDEPSDAEAVYVDSQRYDGNKDKKTDLSVNTLSTGKEQAGE